MAFDDKTGCPDIPALIQERYSQMSRTQQRIGDYILNHTDTICFQSLKQTAAAAGTTEATVLKFCNQLGYSGFLQFKRELQSYVKQRMSPQETLAASLRVAQHEPQIYHRIIETEKRALSLTYAATTPENLEVFVSALRQAGRVFVVGQHVSEVVARSLTAKLRRIGVETYLVDVNDYYDVEQAAVCAREDDLFVMISFPTYSPKVRALVEYLGGLGIKMVSITDRYSSPIAAYSAAVLVCNSDHEVFYNSITAAVSLGSMIASSLALSDPDRFDAYRKKSNTFYAAFRESVVRYRTEQDDMF